MSEHSLNQGPAMPCWLGGDSIPEAGEEALTDAERELAKVQRLTRDNRQNMLGNALPCHAKNFDTAQSILCQSGGIRCGTFHPVKPFIQYSEMDIH